MYTGRTIFTIEHWSVREMDEKIYLCGDVGGKPIEPELIDNLDLDKLLVNTYKASYRLGEQL